MVDDNERRWIPWSREKDAKAQLVAAVLGLLTAVIVSGSGVLRVDRFGYSDFVREMKTERLITEAQIAAAMTERRKQCRSTHVGIERRLDATDRLDETLSAGVKACQDNYTRLNYDVRELRKRLNRINNK